MSKKHISKIHKKYGRVGAACIYFFNTQILILQRTGVRKCAAFLCANRLVCSLALSKAQR